MDDVRGGQLNLVSFLRTVLIDVDRRLREDKQQCRQPIEFRVRGRFQSARQWA